MTGFLFFFLFLFSFLLFGVARMRTGLHEWCPSLRTYIHFVSEGIGYVLVAISDFQLFRIGTSPLSRTNILFVSHIFDGAFFESS